MAESVALQIVPIGLYIVSRRWPVFPPWGPYAPHIGLYFWALFLWPSAAPKGALAYVNALGLLIVLPLARVWACLRAAWAEYEWGYFFLVTLFISFAGGLDIDRFATWQVPLLVVAVARLGRVAAPGGGAWLWLHLLALHAVAMQFPLPWAPDQTFYLNRYGVYAASDVLPWVAASAVLLLLLTGVMLRAASRERDRAAQRAGSLP